MPIGAKLYEQGAEESEETPAEGEEAKKEDTVEGEVVDEVKEK